jgi:F-type H+-transporting ATPase subunit a
VLKNPRLWIVIIASIVAGVAIKLFFPFTPEAVRASVAIAPEILFNIAGFDVTPTLITLVIVFIILIGFAFLSTRNMQLVPSGAQNVMEVIIEQLVNLFEGIAGPMWRKFFTIAASIFLLVLVSNFVGLIPGAGSIGVIKVGEETHSRVENGQVCFEDEEHQCKPSGIFVIGDAPGFLHPISLANKAAIARGEEPEEHAALAPFLRAPTSDINLPLALALVSVFMTQVYGMQKQGLKYWTRFFSFGKLMKGDIAFGLIDVFVGIVELISEIGKIVSFTFRLFGNIFAGEIILLIMAFLFLLLPFPFYAFEFFVAFIQAFVFAVLTMAFMRIATAEHGGEEHAEAHH